MDLDQDYTRIVDQALRDASNRRSEIANETKEQNRDAYYMLYGVFMPLQRTYVKINSASTERTRKSLLVAGLKVFLIEAYDVHELATRGIYFATLRELRYILEFSKGAAKLDFDLPSASLDDKLSEYRRRSNRSDFRGKGLLDALGVDLDLTAQEKERIGLVYGELSNHSHGAIDEISKVSPERNLVPIYRPSLIGTALELAASVCDIHLMLMIRGGIGNSDSIRIRPIERSFFPLTVGALPAS